MEIDITSLVNMDCFQLSHSTFEGGQDAGQETWKTSLYQAEKTPLLDNPEKLEAMREFARSSGGWDAEEITNWTDQELNALFLQWIAGECREAGADSLNEIDWEDYRIECEAGRLAGRLYRGNIPGHELYGRLFFSLSE
jgi:hypothetical protein